ncbi:MAG TPA: hypothetical protein VH277_11580 [Gemmatimonadaceae bacterium]|jgi:hypothetical protein|nr:hypothetical protein [Gemmatimonadaceae bacterium]
MIRSVSAVLLAAGSAAAFATHPAPTRAHSTGQLVVHEWGTITTRHAANGVAEGGLNRLDSYEPLPNFVHRFEVADRGGYHRVPLSKTSDGEARPDVTMRLETPVLYFHTAPGDSIPPFDVTVDFRGGVLNEFYPNAVASASGWDGARLRGDVVGTLQWHGVTLRDHVQTLQTPDHVWLAPRAVDSRPVTIGRESEQYIFYRGMANLEAVLRTDFAGNELRLRGPRDSRWFTGPTAALGRVWVLDVRRDGTSAFRESDSLTLVRGDTTRELTRFRDFADTDYSRATLERLRASMHRALVGRGLYDDEATAMLETWKHNYFLEPGLRVFYIAPIDWVSFHLPLRISVPHTLTRVIVGRVDLAGTGWP